MIILCSLAVSLAVGMPHFANDTLEVVLYSVAGVALLIAGYRLGRLVGAAAASRSMAAKEAELFTAQKGFKQLYEQELANIKAQNEQLRLKAEQMNVKVEEYRK